MPVFAPRSLDEALAVVAENPEAELLAGGTDFMVEVNARVRRPRSVVSLTGVPELRGWRREGADIVLGSMLTYREMLERGLAHLVPGLAQAARTVGSPQIRNAGTLGGNIATASPAGDTLPVLEALGAVVVVGHGDLDHRLVRLDELVTGPKRTCLRPGDLITAIRVPASHGHQEFLKIGRRNAMVVSLASVACVLDFPGRTARLALGAVGPTVIRPREAEELLSSRLLWEERRLPEPVVDIPEIVDLVRRAAAPIDDHRSSGAYRLHAVGICADRALRRALSEEKRVAA